ncbi:MAG: delta-60 repeat domain-containing protein [Bacteroidetes bacterium]|nr:delta-60 repeat domain-containing protein [Bacteroidota bacterium]
MKQIYLAISFVLVLLNFVIAQPGSNDITFNTATGFDASVYSTAIQSDGEIIAGGAFGSFDGYYLNKIARLNTDGTRDNSFDPGSGFAGQGSVETVAIQSDGKIIVGGNITFFNGAPINRIARLNPNGSIDPNFYIGNGFNGKVLSIAVQNDGKIVVGGEFSSFN